MNRARACAAITLTLLAAAGCRSGDGADRVGNPPDPVVVTVGTEEHPTSVAGVMLEQFADEVSRQSGGAVQVDVSYDVADGGVAWDQRAIDRAAAGDFDLVVARAGAWHSRGVTTLDVLQLPGVIETDDQANRLVADDEAMRQLLDGLAAGGFTGLGLYPEAPRYLMRLDGSHDFSLDALHGRTIRAPLNETTFAVLRAVGTLPVDLSAGDFLIEVSDGNVTMTESQLARVELTSTLDGTSDAFVAVNLALYSKFLVLAARADALDDNTLGALRDAAYTIGASFTQARTTQAESVTAACRAGGVLVHVPADDRAAFLSAVQPVIDAFEAGPNGNLLAVVRAAAGSATPTAWTCGADPSSTATPDQPTGLPLEMPSRRSDIMPTPGDVPDGVYRFTQTDEALAESDAPSGDEPFIGEWVLRDGHAELHYFNLDGTPMDGQPPDTDGVYQADDDLMIFATPPERALPGTSGIYLLRWSLDGDTLTLTQIDTERRDPDFAVPWVRVGDAPAS